ncbi:MAG: signal peptidase II [Gammaproteobacteria bacterium]|nr:signal peptidase II [Gammaproteobacteria bacterium]
MSNAGAKRVADSALAWLWLSAVVILLDQLSKHVISSHLALYQSVRVLPFFNLVLLHNTGAAWSFLAGASGWQRWFFVLLALAVSMAIIIWLARLPRTGQRWTAAALALVLGGALGNVIDRLWHGYVIDFIQVYYRHWYYPAFNVADSCITIGAVILVLEGLFHRRATGARGADGVN